MPNNHADVPLLTKADAEHIWNLLPVSKSDPEMHRALSLDALASGAAITKSAAAEEADRARIVALEAEVARCHKRLEIVHRFRGSPPVGEVIPINERATWPDAVRVRNETIALQDTRIVQLTKALATADGYIIRSHDKHRPDWACKQCVGDGALPGADEDFVCVYHAAIARQALSGGSENG